MLHRITVTPVQRHISAAHGANLLDVLRRAGLSVHAPCGGAGQCGKCKVLLDGQEVLACQTVIDRDMTVALPSAGADTILTEGIGTHGEIAPVKDGYLLAFDIGTTTVAGYLLDGKTGLTLASDSRLNPQSAFGADVISRIRHALSGRLEDLTTGIRRCVEEIVLALCDRSGISPAEISVISVVGNPAMQQLFLGIRPDNLARVPFAPVLTRAEAVSAKPILSICENAALLIVPDIAGFIGADTAACVLATQLDEQESVTLLVDIGTNGEMVLGNRHRMVACSTAAGPALEGASITCGMRGQAGAIDHVWVENGELNYGVIGGGEAVGICGSGLIDAVAAALELGWLNSRGRIQNEERIIRLSERVYLTQDDIRQVQMAKGAIAAGIELMAAHLGVELNEIGQVYLAGAFGTYMNPRSACRMGLLPAALAGKITAVGNAAGSGAKLLARSARALDHAQQLVSRIEFLELAALPDFQRCFAKNMRF